MKNEQEELRLILRSSFPVIVVRALETAHVVAELTGTRPLAVVRAEKVQALRLWAEERTVPTD